MKNRYIIILCLVIIFMCLHASTKQKEGFIDISKATNMDMDMDLDIGFNKNNINWKNIKLVKMADDKFKSMKSDAIVKYYNLKKKTINGIETKLKNIGFLV